MRHTGPKDKISRKYGEILSGMPMFEISKRPYPPGQHGQKRTKSSEYGGLLAEKQKLRFSYGVSEKQFEKYFKEASRKKGPTGEILVALLETRLDSMVYRMGFAPTLASARQLVNHGHVNVNGKNVNIPSYSLKPGSEVTISEKAKNMSTVKDALKSNPAALDYLSIDKEQFKGTLSSLPSRNQIPLTVNERLVVEYYSR